MNSDELPGRIAAISVRPPEDRIDVEEAIRAGSKRRGTQRLAVAGAFACVAAATAAAFVLSPRHHDAAPAPVAARPSVTTLPGISGRWLAETLGSQNVSGWRDEFAKAPAELVIGADGATGHFQLLAGCGAQPEGKLVPQADGSFTMPAAPSMAPMSCPAMHTLPPDFPAAVRHTVSVTVSAADASPARTLEFRDAQRKVIARWREDTTIKSPEPLCVKALGSDATADGSLTTVQQLRIAAGSPTAPADLLGNTLGSEVLVYCTTAGSAGPQRWAVGADGVKLPVKPATK